MTHSDTNNSFEIFNSSYHFVSPPPFLNLSRVTFLGLFIAFLLLPAAAAAQDSCASLGSNDKWKETLPKITEQIEKKNYDEALSLARSIYSICPESPILNYFVATCLQNTGDTVKATQFYQTASDNTFKFATAPSVAQKIWYARYEAEYPERSGENVKALQDKANTLEAENHELELKLASASALQSSDNSGNAIGMWTGVGIAAAGLALGGAGIGMALSGNDERSVKISQDKEDNSFTAKFNSEAALYWGLFGAGAALLVAGSVMTGIFGYRYTHTDKTEDIAFTLSPTSASFTFKF
ncbi:MAG: hypothetical protein IJ165_14395 [Proteobacteria bacterium]|nr:hypothetical protein [Pseudomonadota bacterium]